MKNVSIISTAILMLFCLFMSQPMQAQFNQNNATKSITTNTDFNNTQNATLGIGVTTGFNAKLVVQGAVGNTVATFRGSSTGRGIAMVSDWPGLYFNSYYSGGQKSMSNGYSGLINFDPDNGRMDLGVSEQASASANATVNVNAQLSILKNGNVGIGTNAPASRLDITGQDALRAIGFEPFITLLDNNSSKSARIQAAHGDIGFFKGVANGVGGYNYTPQLVIKENGNMGVGMDNPESKIDIAGQDGMRITGYQPFMTLLDNNSYHSARIQAASGDIHFWRGVPNFGNGTYSYSAQMSIKNNGNVLIGTINDPGYKLAVGGKIICEELKVQLKSAWPDYVFADNYKLKPLSEVEAHIKSEKHLPGIPAAAEIEKEGLEVGDMQKIMMEKIEELTLYVIEINKENKALKQRVEQLEGNK